MPDFYSLHPGKVISTAIDKYVYVTINKTPLVKTISARYSITEVVDHPSKLKNDRIRAALTDFGINKNIEISIFSQLPGQTGLGSSSSFSAALIKGLYGLRGKKIDRHTTAEEASRLEIDLLKEPIGKQDQYAAAFGGFNVFQFNKDGSVTVEPVFMDYKKSFDFQNHLLLYFSGITRPPLSVLHEQKSNIKNKFKTLKNMAGMVDQFRDCLLAGNFKLAGELLHKNWVNKKTLAKNISSPVIEDLYDTAIKSGAWGGKILGAGGGGCLLFVVPPTKRDAVRAGLKKIAVKNNLIDLIEIPFNFVQSGAEIIVNSSET